MQQPVPRRARPFKVGVVVPYTERSMEGETPRWGDVLAFAERAEAVGFDSIWLSDHLYFRHEEREPTGAWEHIALLSALAACTRRVEIGTYVTCVSFRNPALLAAMAATIEELSGGRLILGLGAGWNEPEYRAFGFPFDHRVSRFEEAIQIIAPLLRTGRVDFEGRYHSARDCELRLRGPRPNGPPIMVGSVKPRMLGLAIRFADAINVFAPIEELAEVMAGVDQACREGGRDPATLERNVEARVGFPELVAGGSVPDDHHVGSPTEIASTLRRYGEIGAAHLVVRVRPNNTSGLDAFRAVLDELDAQAPDR